LTSAASAPRYLMLARCFPRWSLIVLPALAVLAIVERWLGGKAEAGVAMYLVVLPIAAGTGLLSRAREGKLDLLLAAGVSRFAVWRTAAIHALFIPLAGALLISPLAHGPVDAAGIASIILRTLSAGVFTGGIAFAAGLVEPRYLVGVLWLAVRGVFAMSPVTFQLLSQIEAARHGGPAMEWWQALAVVVAIPEMILDPALDLRLGVVMLLAGTVAIVASWKWFAGAEFAGKRQE